ncbi:hypothetical protein HYV85_00945 [Candidatus Woesearchaeota archaeon]|nr:hypothetical protein [Candidatus Woesearchaeota archaeon]
MSLPTEFSVGMVSELFFRRFKELSIRSLNELREGNRRPELRLIGSFGSSGSTSRLLLKT